MVHMLGYSGQEDGRLPSGVSSSDNDDLSLAAKQRFHRSGGIVDTSIFKIAVVLDSQSPVLRSSRYYDGSRTNNHSASQCESVNAIDLLG